MRHQPNLIDRFDDYGAMSRRTPDRIFFGLKCRSGAGPFDLDTESHYGNRKHHNYLKDKGETNMTQPTHEQGQLQLQIYDLRRGAKPSYVRRAIGSSKTTTWRLSTTPCASPLPERKMERWR